MFNDTPFHISNAQIGWLNELIILHFGRFGDLDFVDLNHGEGKPITLKFILGAS